MSMEIADDGRVLTDIEELLIERECVRLITAYAKRLDLGEVDRVVDLFTEDATYEVLGEFRFTGREELTRSIPSRLSGTPRTTRHLCSNISIEVLSNVEARGVCYFVNYRHDSSTGEIVEPVPVSLPHYVGEYHDRFVRTQDGWRIAHRSIHLTFTDKP